MTPEQCQLLRNSFDLLRDQTAPFVLLFYGKLFELDPRARQLFHNDLAAQGKKVMDMLTSVVESLDNTAPMRAKLLELGKRHSEFGVRPEQYEALLRPLARRLFLSTRFQGVLENRLRVKEAREERGSESDGN